MQIPRYYKPRPQQQDAWIRKLSGQYDYYFKIWHRQMGKDADDIEQALYRSWTHPGTQSAYIGLDNKWIRRNIWDKYLDGRRYFDDYPADKIGIHETQQQIKMLNNPEDKSPALLQFIGFKESESLIGSSYDNFYISELSLYRRGAFDFIQPIWDAKTANGLPLSVNFNLTPRGLNNIAADMLIAYTGEKDPALWPGAHGRTYVDVVPATESLKHDGTRLYSDEHLEKIRQRYIRMMGNDNAFRQEYLCEFLAMNAGLVYPAIEQLRKDKRYCTFNLRSDKPVYAAWDISSKGKESDWTSCVIFQYIDGRCFIYDWYEDNRKSVVECVQELAMRPYFHLIRSMCLPWDSDRSGSRFSPIEECRQAFPNITWVKLDRTYVQDGINRLRGLFPNLLINAGKCEWLIDCFENYEYRQLGADDNVVEWTPKPKHDRYSHLCDAARYMAEMINQYDYIRTNDGSPKKMPAYYGAWDYGDDNEDEWEDYPPGMRPSKFSKLRKKRPKDVFGW